MTESSYQGSYELVTTSGLFLASSVLGFLIGNRKIAAGVFVVWLTSWMYHWPKRQEVSNKVFRTIDMVSNAILSCMFIHEIWPDKRLRTCAWTVVGITVGYAIRKMLVKHVTPEKELHLHALFVHVPWYLTFAYCHYVFHSDTIVNALK